MQSSPPEEGSHELSGQRGPAAPVREAAGPSERQGGQGNWKGPVHQRLYDDRKE